MSDVPPLSAGGEKAASGSPSPLSGGVVPDWDTVDMCLDLLMVVLLRNRDRILVIWPPVLDHLQVSNGGGQPVRNLHVRSMRTFGQFAFPASAA